MKIAILTGAYGVIGQEIARGLVEADCHTILLGRNEMKLKQVQNELSNTVLGSNIDAYSIDLSSKHQIFDLASKIDNHIDVLVNNAATAPRSRVLNETGIEMQWATNVLGYYWMIRAFESNLKNAEKARIINVASYWAGGLDLDDPEFKSRSYNNDAAYRQSKQADRMLAYGFADKFGKRVTVNACHSGDANSKLSNDLGFGGSVSARQAAATPLFLATDADVSDISGSYFNDCREAQCYFKSDTKAIEKLMALCESY
jgi:retinol dehydrogenase-13